ncbi:MAG: hypothetical protein Q9167_002438 [Letrouitia subvulpina]
MARDPISHVSAELGVFCNSTDFSLSVDAPLFLTVSITSTSRHNFRPGDTDPSVPRALEVPLDGWRRQALRKATSIKLTVLINQLEYQATKMEQGGRKAWWDTQRFEEIILVGSDYQCQRAFGAPGSLQFRDCQRASFEFIHQGIAPRITKSAPLRFQSGQCIFKVEATSSDVRPISWDALRAAADILLYTCLERAHAPGTGGQVVFTGSPGPSTGYSWPENLVMTMGRVGVVHETGNATAGVATLPADVTE